MRKLDLVVVVLALTLGCKTVPIEERASITVPAGLNANAVEVYVLGLPRLDRSVI